MREKAEVDVRDGFAGPLSVTAKAFHVLCDNRHFGVSDPRDRVYALIGMIDNLASYSLAVEKPEQRQWRNFTIDYSRSADVPCQELIKFLINADRNLSCLESLGARSSSNNVPSWAIDWNSEALCCTKEAYSIPRLFAYVFHDPLSDPPLISELNPAMDLGRSKIKVPVDLGPVNELRLKGFRLGEVHQSLPQLVIPDSWLFESEIVVGLVRVMKPGDAFHEASRKKLTDLLEAGDLVCKYVAEGRDRTFPRQIPYEKGRLCGVVVSSNACAGDLIVKFHGSRLIHVLRRTDAANTFNLVSSGWFWRANVIRHVDVTELMPGDPHMIFYADIGRLAKDLDLVETKWNSHLYQHFERRLQYLVSPLPDGDPPLIKHEQAEDFILV